MLTHNSMTNSSCFDLRYLDSTLEEFATRQHVTPASFLISPRVMAAQELFQAHVDLDALCGALDLPRSAELHPKGFQQRTNRLCLAQPQSIVLPEGGDPRIIKARAFALGLEVAGQGCAAGATAEAAAMQADDQQMLTSLAYQERFREQVAL